MSDIEYWEYDNLEEELNELMENLEFTNSTLLYPMERNDPQLLQYKKDLIDDIRALRKRLGMSEDFDTTVGYEPFKHHIMVSFQK